MSGTENDTLVKNALEQVFRPIIVGPTGITDLRSGRPYSAIAYQLQFPRTLICDPDHGQALIESIREHVERVIDEDSFVTRAMFDDAEDKIDDLEDRLRSVREYLMDLYNSKIDNLSDFREKLYRIANEYPFDTLLPVT
jgi:hypothetical protein